MVRREDVKSAEGLMEACRIIFGDQAQKRYDEYFNLPEIMPDRNEKKYDDKPTECSIPL